MEEKGIVKAAIFRSHWEAAKKLPDGEQLAFLRAMLDYQFEGSAGEGLPPVVDCLMTAIRPVLDKEAESRGGRPKCAPSADEVAAKVGELGSARAAAEFFGVSERTVYAKLKTAKTAETPDCKGLKTAKTAKTKEERRRKNEEGRMEKEECGTEKGEGGERKGSASAPQAAEPPSPSQSPSSSVPFPSERARRTPPPTREEVAALCMERGYTFSPDTFLAYYGGTGWRRKSGVLVTDWVREAELWQSREKPAEKARASPEYETWRAEDLPSISDEERAAVAAGLEGIFAKLGCKMARTGGLK